MPCRPLSQPNAMLDPLPCGTEMTVTALAPLLSWPDCTSTSTFGWKDLIHAVSSAGVPLNTSLSWPLASPDCQNFQACQGAGAAGVADWKMASHSGYEPSPAQLPEVMKLKKEYTPQGLCGRSVVSRAMKARAHAATAVGDDPGVSLSSQSMSVVSRPTWLTACTKWLAWAAPSSRGSRKW